MVRGVEESTLCQETPLTAGILNDKKAECESSPEVHLLYILIRKKRSKKSQANPTRF